MTSQAGFPDHFIIPYSFLPVKHAVCRIFFFSFPVLSIGTTRYLCYTNAVTRIQIKILLGCVQNEFGKTGNSIPKVDQLAPARSLAMRSEE